MNTQTHIEEGRKMVECLLACPQIPFNGPNIADIPDEPGIFLFSDRETAKALYLGRSRRGTRRHMRDHWHGTSSLIWRIRKLPHITDSQKWLKESVSIRWLTEDEIHKLEMNVTLAEHFAIGALRPEYNR